MTSSLILRWLSQREVSYVLIQLMGSLTLCWLSVKKTKYAIGQEKLWTKPSATSLKVKKITMTRSHGSKISQKQCEFFTLLAGKIYSSLTESAHGWGPSSSKILTKWTLYCKQKFTYLMKVCTFKRMALVNIWKCRFLDAWPTDYDKRIGIQFYRSEVYRKYSTFQYIAWSITWYR